MRKIFFTVAVVMVLMICQVSADYTLQVQGLTNSPSRWCDCISGSRTISTGINRKSFDSDDPYRWLVERN